MNTIRFDQLNLTRDKNLIDDYFNVMVKKELNIDISFSNEYVMTRNIVSKKLILVKTFSDSITSDSQLHLLIQSLIHKINTGLLSRDQMMAAIEMFRENK
ncbi:MAG: hypothetical protein MUW56_01355 [Chryseobacterium sp.]|uniref:hypothetical protein n=1 Tax=Chryseobacterium sp. TaxID=1871047 RepID=UPI0025BABC8D|nr:hypothetical protein [Chryseobacterium sp.]MCJ7932299.1 hypothetical protein [Chryseobacterium sp.]